jgi:hypothetical protein
VGNEENEYPVPDPNWMMMSMANELNVNHKNFSKRKVYMSSLRNSWRSHKRWINRMNIMNSKNIKTIQIKKL